MRLFNLFLSLLTITMLLSCSETPQPRKTNNAIDSTITTSTSEASSQIKKYAIKSGIITFEADRGGFKSTEILYFDNYGLIEREERYNDGKLDEINLCDGKSIYNIKMDKKIAYKIGEAYRGLAYKFDWTEIPEEDQKNGNAKKLENINIAGKNCESYLMKTGDIETTFAGWNNICLQTEQKSKYVNTLVKAVKIEENTAISADKFTVPKDITINSVKF